MGLEDELFKLLSAHSKKSSVIANKIGKAVNIRESVCDVEIEGEAILMDVRFHCIEEDVKSKVVVKPKDKSYVIASIIHGLENDWFISQCSEIEEVLVKIVNVEYGINSKGVLIKNGNDSLKEVLQLIVEATMQIAVVIGNNPDYKKLTEAASKLNKILR